MNKKKLKIKNIVLGGGIAGLSAGYHLELLKEDYLVLEKEETYGGLCSNFKLKGFLFDKFIHLSFTKNDYVKELFKQSIEEIEHIPNAYNYYKGIYLKHPAQNNLYPLQEKEKKEILDSFKMRDEKREEDIKNYEEWLKVQYGEYFAENFPMKYTKKYWCSEAKELSTEWVGSRMYKPTYEEVYQGTQTIETPITYYAQEMYYPETGGYKSYLNKLIKIIDKNIKYNSEIVSIDLESKVIKLKNGDVYLFEKLFSSIPLDKMVGMTKNIPTECLEEVKNLKYTSGYIISLGLKTKDIPPYLWMYIYDENMLSTRIYAPSLKSPKNVPEGCSSLQIEVYFTKDKPLGLSEKEILEKVILELVTMKMINKDDIILEDIRTEEYANIIFTEETYKSRDEIKKYYLNNGVSLIGRFGEWEYFWSDQSFLSGRTSVIKHQENINENNK